MFCNKKSLFIKPISHSRELRYSYEISMENVYQIEEHLLNFCDQVAYPQQIPWDDAGKRINQSLKLKQWMVISRQIPSCYWHDPSAEDKSANEAA